MSSLSYHLDHSDHSVGGITMQLYASTAADLRKAGIDINVPLKTVDGDAIRLIAYDGDHRYPLVGEVIDEGANVAWLARWSRAGRYFGTPEATKKHSMATNVVVSETRPADFISYGESAPFTIKAMQRAAQAVKDHAAPIKDGCYTVEPVHDMGLEEKVKFVPLQTTAQEFDTLTNLRVRLNWYKNSPPPTYRTGSIDIARSKEVVSAHNGKYRRVRAYAKLLTYAAFGRFRWYANENQSIPLDCAEKIVKVLDETDLPFVYLRSPEVGVQNPEVFRQAVQFADKHGGSTAVINSIVASAG